MTSQKFLNNKYGMVLVSDSVTTTGLNKTFPGVEKIFELQKNPGYALMISGSAEFENIPFETIIAKFKKATNFKKIKNIREIKKEFLQYLSENTPKINLNEYILINLKNNFKKQSMECLKVNSGFMLKNSKIQSFMCF